jgi:hypothetical protein
MRRAGLAAGNTAAEHRRTLLEVVDLDDLAKDHPGIDPVVDVADADPHGPFTTQYLKGSLGDRKHPKVR